jgi:hypothetical protein
MDAGNAEARREARAVEIAAAVLVGGLIVLVPSIAMWLVGHLAGLDGSGWAATRQIVLWGTIVVGVVVVVRRLVVAGRRGI